MPYTENETFPSFASVQNLYLLFVGTYNYNCYQFIIAKNPHGIRTFIFHCSYYFHFSGYIKHSKTGNIFICWWKLLLGENCGQSWETEVNNKIELFILTTIFYYLQVGLMTTPPDSILPVSSVLLIIFILEESFTEISSQKIFY